MFHVERHPIQETAPQLRPTRNQAMNLRIDDLQRQGFGKRRRPALTTAVYPYLKALATIPDTELVPTRLRHRLPEKYELLLAVPNNVVSSRTTKRLSPTQIRQRLQETCLPGGVGAMDQIEVGAQFKVGILQAAKIIDLEAPNHS